MPTLLPPPSSPLLANSETQSNSPDTPTMSWLPNPFKSQQQEQEPQIPEQEEEPTQGGGVKEDLSELGKTISRQLWGVASFMAPPPPSTAFTTPLTETPESPSQTLLGIRNDFAEISGSFKSGLSLISNTKAVNEISKLASNLLQLEEEGNDDGDENDEDDGESSEGVGVVGVTEEVLEFVREMAMRPECWISFPLSLDGTDFHLINSQMEHASAVEQLVPSLDALRNKICPSHMSEDHFWMVYFILLYPRLNDYEMELLSTDQIVEARDTLLHNLQKRPNEQMQTSRADVDLSSEVKDSSNTYYKSIVQEEEDADVDQWLEEDDETCTSIGGRNQLGNEQDVSFSDLEDDDNGTSSRQGRSSSEKSGQASSPNGSSGWVQLNENSDAGGGKQNKLSPTSKEKDSEGEESNEWLKVDDFD